MENRLTFLLQQSLHNDFFFTATEVNFFCGRRNTSSQGEMHVRVLGPGEEKHRSWRANERRKKRESHWWVSQRFIKKVFRCKSSLNISSLVEPINIQPLGNKIIKGGFIVQTCFSLLVTKLDNIKINKTWEDDLKRVGNLKSLREIQKHCSVLFFGEIKKPKTKATRKKTKNSKPTDHLGVLVQSVSRAACLWRLTLAVVTQMDTSIRWG